MAIQDAHVKLARFTFQPCVEAFESDFTNGVKVDLSGCSDGDIIRNHTFLREYENCLAGD